MDPITASEILEQLQALQRNTVLAINSAENDTAREHLERVARYLFDAQESATNAYISESIGMEI